MAGLETPSLAQDSARASSSSGTRLLNPHAVTSNVAFNLGGEFIVLCLGAVSIPYVVRSLGADAFGILSLAWVLLTYMTLFDLGLSRATTKFAAEAIGSGNHGHLPGLLTTSLVTQSAMGVVGGGVLFLVSPWVAERLLKIPGPLIAEAVSTFRILALAVPIVLATNCLRGLLEAFQRFDLVNYVKVPTSASIFLSPLVIVPLGGRLPSILALITAFRLVALFVYLALCRSLLPEATGRRGVEGQHLSRLLRYGGWVTVSNVTGPILMYVDRFFLGILVSISAVAYYTAPADMVNRALVVPGSLCSILFPAFSTLSAAGEKERLEDFFARSLKYFIIALGPVLLLVGVFAHDILQYWLGAAFAEHSTLALQILALGVFANALGYFPYSLLQGVGKPNITGILHLIEIPLEFGLVWVLVCRLGIVGAAIASTARVLVDTLLLFAACGHLQLTSLHTLRQRKVLEGSLGVLALGTAMWAGSALGVALPVRVFLALTVLAGYVAAQWRWSCDLADKQFVSEWGKVFMARLRKGNEKSSPFAPES